MKKVFRILDRGGRVVCFQVSTDAIDAVRMAKMYNSKAHAAEFVRNE
jgi:hypothetical protein